MNWKELVEEIDKRPLAVMVGVLILAIIWLGRSYKAEVADHNADLRIIYPLVEKTYQVQMKTNDVLRETNSKKWNEKDTVGF